MDVCLEKKLIGAAGAALSVGIDKLAELIEKTIKNARGPASTLPPFLTTIETMFRPGMSAIGLTSSIVSRLGEAGINTDTLPDGSEPQLTKFVRVTSEETIKKIQLDAVVRCEIPTGTNIGQAGNIPVATLIPVQLSGIMQ